jgi:hypothetical protein
MSSRRANSIQPRAEKLIFTKAAMSLHLADGRTLVVPLAWYPRLSHGSPRASANYEIIGEGSYIHWPDLDEDLTVVGLLEGRKSAESAASIKKWFAGRMSHSPSNKSRPKKQARRAS